MTRALTRFLSGLMAAGVWLSILAALYFIEFCVLYGWGWWRKL